MNVQIAADKITELVTANPAATYEELQQHMQQAGLYSYGDYDITLPADNLVLWTGMSEPFVDAIRAAHKDQRIHPHLLRSDFEIVLCYKTLLTFPVARKVRCYATWRWLPVVWLEGAACSKVSCLGSLEVSDARR